MDYQGNSKLPKSNKLPEKVVEKVVKGEVVVQKKPLGRKIKDLFVEADLRTVMHYVATDVLLPAARNMIVDASSKGVERLMYGEAAVRRRPMGQGGPRITYNSPINREWRDPSTRPPVPGANRVPRRSRDDFILASRGEAEMVLERMNDIIDNYEVVSVSDLHELVGFPTSHVDNKWGWMHLQGVSIQQVREGYLIDLPAPEPIA